MLRPTRKQGRVHKDGFPRLSYWTILPLRAFLGSTFVYAGLQKLTDPRFFDPASSGFIGHQLALFAQQSPLGWLLTGLAIPHATFFGTLIAFGELWIGLATLLGLFARLAASVGAFLNLLLWLTATWNVHPYFLGSDTIYAVAWLTLALAGTGAYSLDRWLAPQLRQERAVATDTLQRISQQSPSAQAGRKALPVHFLTAAHKITSIPRRALLREALAGGLLLASGAAIGALARLLASPSLEGKSTANAGEIGASVTPSPSSGGTPIGNTSQVAINSAFTFTLRSNCDPGVLVRLSETQYVAFDATCTHAGCPVDYDAEEEKFVCPCHGAIFDPARHGKVLGGPTDQPLVQLPLRIDAAGTIFVFA